MKMKQMVQTSSINQQRIETHRALELLSDYYSKLTRVQEKYIIIEIERVIRLLKSKFFQALIDIQEFHETLLADEIKTNDLSRIDGFPIIKWAVGSNSDLSQSSTNIFDPIDNLNPRNEWEKFNINISRGESGLGFSIAGGTDTPHLRNDPRIYITKVIPGSPAAVDGRLKINDSIDSVNDVSISEVTHTYAVETLRHAGGEVKLTVRRKIQDVTFDEIELMRSEDGLGFSIAGGIGNQHIPGENNIYITKVMNGGAAHKSGRIRIGDRIVALKTDFGIRDLRDVTHEEAVNVLKTTQKTVTLYVIHPEDGVSTSTPITLFPERIQDIDECSMRDKEKGDESCSGNLSLQQQERLSSTITTSDRKPQLRTIILSKGSSGFGFNIVGGENGDNIFISSIHASGSAYEDGNLRKGDKLISVNGIDFSNISHEEAAFLLKGISHEAKFIVEYNEDEYVKFTKKLSRSRCSPRHFPDIETIITTTEKKTFHIRALFNYDPNQDDDLPSIGLSFQFGDILLVTNAGNDEWWLATKIHPKFHGSESGLIPSRKRWERKMRARDRSVKFEGHIPVLLDKQLVTDKKRKNYIFSRRFPFMKNKDEELYNYCEPEPSLLCYAHDDAGAEDIGNKEIFYRVELPHIEELTMVYLEKNSGDVNDQHVAQSMNVIPYEEVKEIIINYKRPVIIFGPIKDRINDDLISRYPQEFESCVPHTTRPRREEEMNGEDYHFMTCRADMEKEIQENLFIEAGQYNENLYGTSITSIESVMTKGKHCILDVSGNAIERLHIAHIYPISLYVDIQSPEAMINMDSMTLDPAEMSFMDTAKLQHDFTQFYTGMIKGAVYEDAFKQVRQIISNQSMERIWVPAGINSKKISSDSSKHFRNILIRECVQYEH